MWDMDAKFHPAMDAIKAGNLEQLRSLIDKDPTLATTRSSCGHPTLLQCLILDAVNLPNKVEMAKILVDAGAEINGPLVACGSCDNPELAALLLDRGAAIDGTGDWSPLEEALYWNSPRTMHLLLQRGAAIQNLRIAAGLGRTDLIESSFNPDGTLKPQAGTINWPWGKVLAQQKAAQSNSWTNVRQNIINNAFVYACMHGHIDAAKSLLAKGAEVNAIPGGFDYSGTALHYAALNGHRPMVDFLIQSGADASLKDTKVEATAAGWAEYGGHPDIGNHLRSFSPAG